MEMGIIGTDIWVKHTAKDGASHVSYHRVWDIGIFHGKPVGRSQENWRQGQRRAGHEASSATPALINLVYNGCTE